MSGRDGAESLVAGILERQALCPPPLPFTSPPLGSGKIVVNGGGGGGGGDWETVGGIRGRGYHLGSHWG